MNAIRIGVVVAAVGILAGCTTTVINPPPTAPSVEFAPRETPPARTTGSMSMEHYKRTVAQYIARVNPDKIYPGNPQAMLRSVVVLKYAIDVNGRLVRSETLRSNGDLDAIATALAALRKAAPFPQPPTNLLSHGQLELLETVLFNDDGRFQLRSIAAPQLDE